MEFITIAMYTIDFILRFHNHRMLIKTGGIMPHSTNEYERKLHEDKEEY